MNEDLRLAAYFAELSGELSSSTDEPLTFQRVVDRAKEVVPGCDHCGLHLRTRRGRAVSAAATDAIADEADKLQEALGDGPCVDAAFENENFVIHDLRTEQRWPTWSPRAAALGIRSTLSIRLTSDHETIG